ncbi:hypothetical protein PO909_005765 [Leuciscus waleckii]
MERTHALSHDLETQQRKRSWNNEEKNKHCVKITAPNDTVQPSVMNVKEDPLGSYTEMMAKGSRCSSVSNGHKTCLV